MILHLPPMPTDAEPVIVPGLLTGLGITRRAVDRDFQASLDSGLTESFEDYCTRISAKEAS
ncbi:hypothetical protein OG713_34580 [Streptomyces sp. NBC_00723]|uniref:hypothetical protein n=1 Tax=Streptomyces sp. NBC_00723 TaxID=2903673 RepID=UPI003865258E